MYYSEEIVETVRQASDIVDVISSNVRLKRTGNSMMGLCPFHSEKSPSFNVSPSKQFYHCFGCGKSGNVFTFLMEYEGLTFPDALKQLAERANIALPEQYDSAQAKQNADFRQKMLNAYRDAAVFYVYCMKNDTKAQRYFKERMLSEETIRGFGLGYAPIGRDLLYQYLKKQGHPDEILRECGLIRMDERRGVTDYFWDRVMFPIMDVNQRVIAFGGRVLSPDAKPKYLNSPESRIFDKSRNLYGLHLARKSQRKELLLCEGYMDVIALHQAGFDNAVASLGTSFTSMQANVIRRYTDTVLLTYDSDGAGQSAVLRAIPILRDQGISAKVVDMSPYKDPDEFIKNIGAEEYQKRLDNAKPGFYFEMDTLQKGYDLDDPEQKTKFLHEVAKLLLNFEEDLERNNYLEAAAKRYDIRTEDLRAVVGKISMQLAGREPTKYVRREQTEVAGRKKRTGYEQAVRMYFFLISNQPSLIDQFGLVEDDFIEEPYHTICSRLFDQYRKTKQVDPAAVVNTFTDVKDQDDISGIFFEQVPEHEDMTQERLNWLVEDLRSKIRAHVEKQKQEQLMKQLQSGNQTDPNELFRQLVSGKRQAQNHQRKR